MPIRWGDALAGLGLVVALGLVILFDRPTTSAVDDTTSDLPVQVISESTIQRQGARRLRLAVTPTQLQRNEQGIEILWDDMGKLLKELGDGYQFTTVEPDAIARRPETLDAYDVLFLTCAQGGEELREALVKFVERGGTLYASDFRYDAVAAAFPQLVDESVKGSGTVQTVDAEVLDPPLREILGPRIPLRFDLSAWKTAAFRGPAVTTLISGVFQRQRTPNDLVGDRAIAPLMTRFRAGKGTVVFTSFHNEKQNSELEKKLLQYLVFSLVTAKVDAEVQQTIEQAGFAPAKSNLLSAPKGQPSVTKTHALARRTTLRFALGFRNEGAKLRLAIKAPDGRQWQRDAESTLVVEVPAAAPGEWSYTVTAVHLPYENFPFTVTVGEKK